MCNVGPVALVHPFISDVLLSCIVTCPVTLCVGVAFLQTLLCTILTLTRNVVNVWQGTQALRCWVVLQQRGLARVHINCLEEQGRWALWGGGRGIMCGDF